MLVFDIIGHTRDNEFPFHLQKIQIKILRVAFEILTEVVLSSGI
jgi:hypothetical protein